MYDFGMLDLMPGNVVDAGDSKDVIDETDLEAFRKIMDGQNTVTVTYDKNTGTIIKTTSIGSQKRTEVYNRHHLLGRQIRKPYRRDNKYTQ